MVSSHLNAVVFSISFLLFCRPNSANSVSTNSTDLDDILNELSWTLKLKLWNQMDKTTTETFTTPKTTSQTLQESTSTLRSDWESLYLPKRRADDETGENPEEHNMRMKLFRLMYETIRDSDLKVKRAELIREHYVNSTVFQTGYLLGDVTDKYNTVIDISSTLKRFYDEWNAIEHINAYEQIANQAIEINHLIDMIRVMNKRNQQCVVVLFCKIANCKSFFKIGLDVSKTQNTIDHRELQRMIDVKELLNNLN